MNPQFERTVSAHLKFLGDDGLTPDAGLADLGLDSMQAIDLLFDLEDAFDVSLPDSELNETTFATAGNLWGAVVRAGSPAGTPPTGQAPR
jgi:acyl carrier protein